DPELLPTRLTALLRASVTTERPPSAGVKERLTVADEPRTTPEAPATGKSDLGSRVNPRAPPRAVLVIGSFLLELGPALGAFSEFRPLDPTRVLPVLVQLIGVLACVGTVCTLLAFPGSELMITPGAHLRYLV